MTPSKKRVLILCTGNSCRSILAEAIWRHLAGDRYEVVSAGTHPKGVHPLTVQVLQERGVPVAGLRSKSIHEVETDRAGFAHHRLRPGPRTLPISARRFRAIALAIRRPRQFRRYRGGTPGRFPPGPRRHLGKNRRVSPPVVHTRRKLLNGSAYYFRNRPLSSK
jgi:hypothetical protein